MAQGEGYEGTVASIKCGLGGLQANLNPSNIRLKNVITSEGVVFRQDMWRKEPGTATFGSFTTDVGDLGNPAIYALFDWHPTESIQKVVSLRNGQVWSTTNGGTIPDAIMFTGTGASSGPGTQFGFFLTGGSESSDPTTGKRKLFLFRNNWGLSYIDGDATAINYVTNPAADWTSGGANNHPPICGIINNNRLWAAGNDNNPHQLYASQFANHLNFSVTTGVDADPQFQPIFPGVGERIYALRNYQGFIVVFKYPRGIFLMDARDTIPANWLTQQITDQVGITQTPYAALQLENDVIFMGSDGQFYLLSALIEAAKGNNNLELANLGQNLEIYQFLLGAFNRQVLFQVQSVYQPFWQTAQFTITGPASTTNNTRMIYDFNSLGRQGGEPRFSYSYRDQATSFALWRDPSDFIDKPIYGDYFGNIIKLEQDSANTWNNIPYNYIVQTPHANFGEFEGADTNAIIKIANRNKIFDFIEIEFFPFTTADISIQVYVDGTLKQTINTSLPFTGTPLDSFILDTDTLALSTVRSIVRRLNVGSGRRVSFKISNINKVAQDVAISHVYVYFRLADTTQVPRT